MNQKAVANPEPHTARPRTVYCCPDADYRMCRDLSPFSWVSRDLDRIAPWVGSSDGGIQLTLLLGELPLIQLSEGSPQLARRPLTEGRATADRDT